MKTTTTTISQGIRQGLDKLVELKEAYTMQSTIKNLVGNESILRSLAGNARMFVLTALAGALLLLGGTQFGTAFAQPVSDPVTIFTSSGFESWNSMAEENDFLPLTPKVVLATSQAYISEENGSLRNSPKVVIATRQAYISEENESLPTSSKVVLASRQAYISEENDFGI
jgi:hypothetical protein